MTDIDSEHVAPLRIAAPAPNVCLDPPAAMVAAWLMSELADLQVEQISVDEVRVAIPTAAQLGRTQIDTALQQPRFGGWELAGSEDGPGGPPGPAAA